MIFNTWAYYLFFLVPSAILFRLSSFFLYFSCTELGGIIPAACLGIFLWESITSRFYRPKACFCWVGVAQAIVLLFIFKSWNFFAGLVAQAPPTRCPKRQNRLMARLHCRVSPVNQRDAYRTTAWKMNRSQELKLRLCCAY